MYIPDRKVLCTGDFIIWAAPNAGNPQKAQRYAREWAEALRAMARTGAEVLLPGHGYPVFGLVRVRQVLLDTANYLQSLYDQTIAMMNNGATLDEVIHTVKPPAELADKPWLQPVYDEPEFIVRNIWRLEGGWYDGALRILSRPPRPSGRADRGNGGRSGAGSRARVEKLAAGELALACHLADWAVAAAPDDKSAHEARMKVYAERASRELSTMAHGIFRSAAIESAAKAGVEPPHDSRGHLTSARAVIRGSRRHRELAEDRRRARARGGRNISGAPANHLVAQDRECDRFQRVTVHAGLRRAESLPRRGNSAAIIFSRVGLRAPPPVAINWSTRPRGAMKRRHASPIDRAVNAVTVAAKSKSVMARRRPRRYDLIEQCDAEFLAAGRFRRPAPEVRMAHQ